jgi:hypothetical protein
MDPVLFRSSQHPSGGHVGPGWSSLELAQPRNRAWSAAGTGTDRLSFSEPKPGCWVGSQIGCLFDAQPLALMSARGVPCFTTPSNGGDGRAGRPVS